MRWWLLAMLACAIGARADLFEVGGRRAQSAIVTDGREPPGVMPGSPMLARLTGVVAELDVGQVAQIRSAAKPNRRGSDLAGSRLVWAIYLRAGTESRRLEVRRRDDGAWLLSGEGERGDKPGVMELSTNEWLTLCAPWSVWRLEAEGEPPSGGVTFELSKPYVPGWVVLDEDIINRRIVCSSGMKMDPPRRVLDEQVMIARMPRGWTPRTMPGLLVWIDPSDMGTPPPQLHDAADQLNLILVGARGMGNETHLCERLQLALDCVATCCERFAVDQGRVYVTGFSGGGRMSSWLWGCFPDIFAGAAPICGLDSYKRAIGPRREVYPAWYDKAEGVLGKALRTRRLAPITGAIDMNHDPVLAYAKGLERDGLAVRVFDYPDMGHELPSAQRFAEAMAWVDELAQRAVIDGRATARLRLADYLLSAGDRAPQTEAEREALVEITRLSPWSEEAWKAAELLGAAAVVSPPVEPAPSEASDG